MRCTQGSYSRHHTQLACGKVRLRYRLNGFWRLLEIYSQRFWATFTAKGLKERRVLTHGAVCFTMVLLCYMDGCIGSNFYFFVSFGSLPLLNHLLEPHGPCVPWVEGPQGSGLMYPSGSRGRVSAAKKKNLEGPCGPWVEGSQGP